MSNLADEIEKLLRKAVREEVQEGVKVAMLKFNNSIVPIQQSEGGVEFALEILREKAGLDSLSTLYKWSHEGRVPYTKRGKKLWFRRESLEEWIESGMPHAGQTKAANRLSNSIR